MEPFKNMLSASAVGSIADALVRSDSSFDRRAFLRNIAAELEPLELKQRVLFVTARLHRALPADVNKSFPILVGALKQDTHDTIGLSGFRVWPLTRYVSDHGLDHFDVSMRSLHAMTQVFTAEFDIRPFLLHHEEKTLRMLTRWTKDPNEHVRRLVSEGTRPLLPWGERVTRFVEDPSRTWRLLEALRNDPSMYVRKSVANHINDHSKHHGDWVVQQLMDWQRTYTTEEPHLDWIIRHATRTLVKRGHVGALKLHGVSSASVEIVSAKIRTPRLKLGGALDVQVVVRNISKKPAQTIVDHELRLLKANGAYSSKVFKGKKLVVKGGETVTLEMKIPLRVVTVRSYYPGTQYWVPVVNGVKSTERKFVLDVPR